MSLDYKKILFKSYRPWLTKDSDSIPVPTQNIIPQWYKDADRFAKMPNGEYFKATAAVCPVTKEGTTDDYGKVPTWKACPAILDAFITGYTLRTPCDLKFFKNSRGVIDVEVSDVKNKGFCVARPPMHQFENPRGYYKDHFAWMPDWGLELPEGYSALFMTPMNRFDLPFINTTGIVDSDKVGILGSFPFFIAEGWEGVLPAGTPFLQVLPFRRENWEHEIEIQNPSTVYAKMMENSSIYRKPDGGIYKNEVWSRREYK